MNIGTLEILMLVFVFVVVAGSVGFFVLVVVANRVGDKRLLKQKLELWRRIGGVLGLQVTAEAIPFGKYNGLDVALDHKLIQIQQGIFKNDSSIDGGASRHLRCLFCTARFPHPLNLSLNLQFPKALPFEAPPNNIVIGHPGFDSRFDAVCVNKQKLLKLLSTNNSSGEKNLLTEILETNHYVETANMDKIADLLSGPKSGLERLRTYHLFVITDTDVTVKLRCDFEEISEHSVKQILDLTTHIARQIYDARLKLR